LLLPLPLLLPLLLLPLLLLPLLLLLFLLPLSLLRGLLSASNVFWSGDSNGNCMGMGRHPTSQLSPASYVELFLSCSCPSPVLVSVSPLNDV
jgi:hypothetical protein